MFIADCSHWAFQEGLCHCKKRNLFQTLCYGCMQEIFLWARSPHLSPFFWILASLRPCHFPKSRHLQKCFLPVQRYLDLFSWIFSNVSFFTLADWSGIFQWVGNVGWISFVQGDYAALLSSFAELGLKLRMDMPEDAMAIMNFFFRRSIPGRASQVCLSFWSFVWSR